METQCMERPLDHILGSSTASTTLTTTIAVMASTRRLARRGHGLRLGLRLGQDFRQGARPGGCIERLVATKRGRHWFLSQLKFPYQTRNVAITQKSAVSNDSVDSLSPFTRTAARKSPAQTLSTNICIAGAMVARISSDS